MRRLRIYPHTNCHYSLKLKKRNWCGGVVLFLVFFFTGCVSLPRPYQVPPVGGVYHIVDSGQTLYRIAKVYNVDLEEIMRANNIRDPRHLGVGQELLIPGARTPLYVEPYKPQVPQSIKQLDI